MQDLIESSLGDDEPSRIRRRAAEDGYVFARGLLPAEAIRTVRRDIVGVLSEHGWLQSSHEPMLGLVDVPACAEGDAQFWPVFDQIQRLESFHWLAQARELLHGASTLLDAPVFAHPRNIIRLMFPAAPITPPHQDYLHVQGSSDTWTAWIPLGDCSSELGGLAILPGSHKAGLLPAVPMMGAGGQGIADDLLSGEWGTADYRAGDVLFVHSLCVHKSKPNATRDRLRISVDYRYQRVVDAIDPRALDPHFGRATWDEIYQEWSSADYQYYWHDLQPNVTTANSA